MRSEISRRNLESGTRPHPAYLGPDHFQQIALDTGPALLDTLAMAVGMCDTLPIDGNERDGLYHGHAALNIEYAFTVVTPVPSDLSLLTEGERLLVNDEYIGIGPKASGSGLPHEVHRHDIVTRVHNGELTPLRDKHEDAFTHISRGACCLDDALA